MAKQNNISSFLRELEGLEVKPSPGVWEKINRRLAWREFTRFNFSTFNIYYIIIALGLITAGLYLYLSHDDGATPVPATPFGSESIEFHDFHDEKPVEVTDSVDEPSLSFEEGEIPVIIEEEAEQLIVPESHVPETILPVISLSVVPDTMKADLLPEIPETLETIPVPHALFSSSVEEGCMPLKAWFFNHSLHAEEYLWNFGDGGISKEKEPVYVFDEPGVYIVSLTAITEGQHESVYSLDIKVHGAPTARFEADIPVNFESGQPVYFYNYSRGATEYLWDFGDGNISTMKDPMHGYLTSGTYNIKLLAVSSEGCMDSMIIMDALREEEADIRFPTAFSPVMSGSTGGYFNGRERNHEVFYPYTSEQPVDYLLRIFNRTGLLVFESKDINIGWDGYHHQELQPAGVYVWKVRARFESGRTVVKAGDVTVVWGSR